MLSGPIATQEPTWPSSIQARTIQSIAESFTKSVMAERACKCLNVRIRPQQHERANVANEEGSDFESVHVGDTGIIIVSDFFLAWWSFYDVYAVYIFQLHTHLTIRSRKRLKTSQESGSPSVPSQTLQHVSVTCLICHLLVYRVLQAVPLDVDSSEGPVLPTEEWVEEEILKSSSGWIEVSKQCIVSPLFRSTTQLSVIPNT